MIQNDGIRRMKVLGRLFLFGGLGSAIILGSFLLLALRFSLMLGVNATTDSVSRLEKVAWRRTLGWKWKRSM
jgi:hypothetical protein